MKIVGHCSACGDECFDVLETWPQGHVLAGEPRRLGAPHDDARRVTLILMDGRTTTMTFHDRCIQDAHTQFTDLWRRVNERYRRERKAHRALGHRDFTPAQHAHADAVQLDFISNPPLGVLAVEKWNAYV